LTDGSQRATITLLDAALHQLRTEQRKIQEKYSARLDSAAESSPRAAAGRFTIGVFGGIPALIDGVREVVGSNPTAPTSLLSTDLNCIQW
jgi:hypothetical protein